MRFRYDPEAGALYVRMREGAVADTIEVEELVYLDVDEDGRPLGIEFVVAEQLPEFLTRRGGEFVLPGSCSRPGCARRAFVLPLDAMSVFASKSAFDTIVIISGRTIERGFKSDSFRNSRR